MQNTNATLRTEITLRPIANAMNISVVIKNARMVAVSQPDKTRYPNSPTWAHAIAGIFAGIRRVITGIARNSK